MGLAGSRRATTNPTAAKDKPITSQTEVEDEYENDV